MHGGTVHFNRVPEQGYAYPCSPIFTKEFCTILKRLHKLSCHVSHVFLYWREANKRGRLVTSPQGFEPNEPTMHCTFYPPSRFHLPQPWQSCTWRQLEKQGETPGWCHKITHPHFPVIMSSGSVHLTTLRFRTCYVFPDGAESQPAMTWRGLLIFWCCFWPKLPSN